MQQNKYKPLVWTRLAEWLWFQLLCSLMSLRTDGRLPLLTTTLTSVRQHLTLRCYKYIILSGANHSGLRFLSEKIQRGYYMSVLMKHMLKLKHAIQIIKYHTWPRTPYGKVTKTQDNITRTKRSAISQQVATRLQRQDSMTRSTNNKKDITDHTNNIKTSLQKRDWMWEDL